MSSSDRYADFSEYVNLGADAIVAKTTFEVLLREGENWDEIERAYEAMLDAQDRLRNYTF
jgi:hypothetical protein